MTLELSVDPGLTEAVVESKNKPKRAYVQNRNAPKPRSHALTYAAFGLSGVGVVVGAVTGYMFLGARSDLNAACPNGKCPSTYADYDDVHGKYITYGTISGASWTVGVLSGVTGIWLLLSNEPKASDARAKRVDCVPYVTANSVGLVGAF